MSHKSGQSDNFMDHDSPIKEDSYMEHESQFPMIAPLDSYYSIRREDPYAQASNPYTIMSRLDGHDTKMDDIEDHIKGLPTVDDLERLKDQVMEIDGRLEHTDSTIEFVVEKVNEANEELCQEILQLKRKIKTLEDRVGLNRLGIDMTKYRLTKLIRKLHVRMR